MKSAAIILSLLCATALHAVNPEFVAAHKKFIEENSKECHTIAGTETKVETTFHFSQQTKKNWRKSGKIDRKVTTKILLTRDEALEIRQFFQERLSKHVPNTVTGNLEVLRAIVDTSKVITVEIPIGSSCKFRVELDTCLFPTTIEQLIELIKTAGLNGLHDFIANSIKKKISNHEITICPYKGGTCAVVNDANQKKAAHESSTAVSQLAAAATIAKASDPVVEPLAPGRLTATKLADLTPALVDAHEKEEEEKHNTGVFGIVRPPVRVTYLKNNVVEQTVLIKPSLKISEMFTLRERLDLIRLKCMPGYVIADPAFTPEELKKTTALRVEVPGILESPYVLNFDSQVFPITLDQLVKLIEGEGFKGVQAFVDKTIKQKLAAGEISLRKPINGVYGVFVHKKQPTKASDSHETYSKWVDANLHEQPSVDGGTQRFLPVKVMLNQLDGSLPGQEESSTTITVNLTREEALALPTTLNSIKKDYLDGLPEAGSLNRRLIAISIIPNNDASKIHSCELDSKIFPVSIEQLARIITNQKFNGLYCLIGASVAFMRKIAATQPAKAAGPSIESNPDYIAYMQAKEKLAQQVDSALINTYELNLCQGLKNYKTPDGVRLGKGIRPTITLSLMKDGITERTLTIKPVLSADVAHGLPYKFHIFRYKYMPGHIKTDPTFDAKYLQQFPFLNMEWDIAGTKFTIGLDTLVFPITMEQLAELIQTEGLKGLQLFVDKIIKQKLATGEIRLLKPVNGNFGIGVCNKIHSAAIPAEIRHFEDTLALDGWDEKAKTELEQKIAVLRAKK